MTELTPRETSLVALGAALASNCIPCIEHHVPLARKNGLSEAEIFAAIELADRIRQGRLRLPQSLVLINRHYRVPHLNRSLIAIEVGFPTFEAHFQKVSSQRLSQTARLLW